jgi:hypothetical protein
MTSFYTKQYDPHRTDLENSIGHDTILLKQLANHHFNGESSTGDDIIIHNTICSSSHQP